MRRLVVLLMIAFLSIPNLLAVDCGPDPATCTPYIQRHITEIIYLPDYPNCPVEVDYVLIICGNVWTINELYYHPDWFNGNLCDDLYNDLVKIDQLGETYIDWNQHEKNLDAAFHELSIKYFEEAEYLGGSYNCPNSFFYIEYRKPSCLSHCATMISNPQSGGLIPYSMKWDSCVETVCCVLQYEMCKDENSELQISITSTEMDDCTAPTPQHHCVTVPPPGWIVEAIFQSPCRAQCNY